MKEIEKKIQELITLNGVEDNWEEDFMDKQDKLMTELTALARKNKTLVGRNIRFPVADGYAIYLIVKENKKTVKIQWIDYCDGYTEYFLGNGLSTLSMDNAISNTNWEDSLDRMKKTK